MKKLKKTLPAAVTVLALCLTLFLPMPARAADVCFTAINDRVLELTSEMPIWSGDVLYAPYTTFDAGVNGVKWNIECSYNKTTNMLTVFDINERTFLEFDLREGTCVDPINDRAYNQGAIIRGGTPYLPVRVVCSHFGLRYSYREIEQGNLLRIKNDDVILSDTKFLDAAGNALDLRLREYNQSQGEGEETPSGTLTPQDPGGTATESGPNVSTYLAFRCEDAEYLETLLLTLEVRGVHGMFLLPPELIRERSDLVIWMLGAGHSVGLLAQGDTAEATRAILEEGSALLAGQVFLRAGVAMVPQEQRATFKQESWVCWNGTLDLTPTDSVGPNYFSSRVMAQLKGRELPTYLSLDVSANTLRVLPTLLNQLENGGFHVELPLETRL